MTRSDPPLWLIERSSRALLRALVLARRQQRLLALGAPDQEAALKRLLPGALPEGAGVLVSGCLLYTSPSPRDQRGSRMPSSA